MRSISFVVALALVSCATDPYVVDVEQDSSSSVTALDTTEEEYSPRLSQLRDKGTLESISSLDELTRLLDATSADLEEVAAVMSEAKSCDEALARLAPYKKTLSNLPVTQARAMDWADRRADRDAAEKKVLDLLGNGFRHAFNALSVEIDRAMRSPDARWSSDCKDELSKILLTEALPPPKTSSLGDCKSTSPSWYTIYYNRNKKRTYRIDEGLLNRTDDRVTYHQARTAIITGAEYWNHETNSGVYQYEGTHSSGGSYWSAIDCRYNGRKWGNFYYSSSSDAGATTYGDCCWGAGIYCETFRVAIKKPTTYFSSYVSITAHELGHPFELDHPDNWEYALMCNSSEADCHDPWPRRLREYDIDCAIEKGGKTKKRFAYYRLHDSDGSFSAPGQMPYQQGDALRVSSTAAWWTYDFIDVFADHLEYLPAFGYGNNTIAMDASRLITPTGATFEGDANNKYLFYRRYVDPTSLPELGCSGGMGDAHCGAKLFNVMISDDDFATWTTKKVRKCVPNSVWSPFHCNDASGLHVSSLRKLEVTHYPGGRAGIFQVPETELVFYIDHNEQIHWVAGPPTEGTNDLFLGYDQDSQIADWLSGHSGWSSEMAYSRVKPAVACSSSCGDASLYQCKLAFVPRHNIDGRIWFWNFNVAMKYGMRPPNYYVPYRYTISWDPYGPQVGSASPTTNLRSGGDLAMWENGGSFYLGFKTVNTWDERVKVYKKAACSNNMGSGWALADDSFGWTDDGLNVTELPSGKKLVTYTATNHW